MNLGARASQGNGVRAWLQRMTSIAQTSQGEATNVADKFVSIGYNAAGLTTSVDAYLAATADSDYHVYHLATDYDLASRTTSIDYTSESFSGGGTLAAYHYVYDGLNQTDFYSYRDTSDSGDSTSDYTTWARAQYAYNPDGWLSSIGDVFSGGTSLASGGGPPAAATYTNWANAPTTDADRGYDNNGNLVGSEAIANRLSFDGTYYYQYGAEGNRTAKFKSSDWGTLDSTATDITIYGWDNRNRMISLKHYADWSA